MIMMRWRGCSKKIAASSLTWRLSQFIDYQSFGSGIKIRDRVNFPQEKQLEEDDDEREKMTDSLLSLPG